MYPNVYHGYFAFPKGHSKIVDILVNVCNLEAVDDHKISPLFVAAQYGQQECLEILVNAGKWLFFFQPLHILHLGSSHFFIPPSSTSN